jgi:hypothetical protein
VFEAVDKALITSSSGKGIRGTQQPDDTRLVGEARARHERGPGRGTLPQPRVVTGLGRAGHPTTRLSTATTPVGTGFHLLVASVDAFTVLSTALTDFRTHPAYPRVQVGTAKHEVGARLANLGTIEQQANVAPFRMLPAHLQAVRRCFDAYTMAISAVLNALLHLGAHVLHTRLVAHHHSTPLHPHIRCVEHTG